LRRNLGIPNSPLSAVRPASSVGGAEERKSCPLQKLRLGENLYDRSGSGEFFLLYTDFIDDRFYFEIVERRGDYRSFGAIHAPVRLAAQSEVYRRSLIEIDESY
jgi:4-hydroxyphenylpyruvate dioxygenase-like putative hemolysin